MEVVLRAWPQVHARTGARLRIVGADPLRVRLALARHRLPGEGIDALGPIDDDSLSRELLDGQGARRAVARRRELRDGADARLRLLDSGRRLRHRRLPRGDGAGTGIAVPPGDVDALARGLIELLEDEPRRVELGRAEARASWSENYAWDDIARRLLESTRKPWARAPGRRGGAMIRRVPRVVWGGGFSVAMLAVVAFLLIWRGPDWNEVLDAFTFVEWWWIVAAIALNVCSVCARCLSWHVVITQAMPPPHPQVPSDVLRLLGRAAGELGAPGPDRRAGPGRRPGAPPAERKGDLGDADRDGLRPPAVRPLPGRAAPDLRAPDGEDPALGGDEPRTCSWVSARPSSPSRWPAPSGITAPGSRRRTGSCTGC